VKNAPIKAREDGKAAALPTNATPSGTFFTPFPAGCDQKNHARHCKALPGVNPGCVSRFAHGFFGLATHLVKVV
jgi:hypothetical protein